MKKSFISLLLLFAFVGLQAQDNAAKTIASFPYQKSADAKPALATMESWGKSSWKELITMLDDDSLKLKATYALNAYTHHVALDATMRNKTAALFNAALSSVKSRYAKDLLIQELGLLGDQTSIKPLSKLLKDEVSCGAAARALATFKTEPATVALIKALASSKAPFTQQIQAAIDYANFKLPVAMSTLQPAAKMKNKAQQLLDLQDQMAAAKNPVQQRNILSKADHLDGLGTLMFAKEVGLNQLATAVYKGTAPALTDVA
jgi:HEAT repeat protein